MKNTVRILALLLACLMMLGALVSCKKQDEGAKDGNAATTVSGIAVDPTNPMYEEDGEGRDVIVLCREAGESYLFSYNEINVLTEDTESRVNQAVYERNLHINETFNVNLVASPTTAGKIVGEVNKDVLSDTQMYDIVMPMANNAFDLSVKGLVYEWSSIPYVDETKDYWMTDFYNSTSIGGYHFFCPGSANISAYNTVGVTFFNKNMLTDLKDLPNPYELVKSGNWTIEQLKIMATAATADSDGLQGMTHNDTYGLAVNAFVWQPFFHSSGYMLVEKDENDIPYLAAIEQGTSEIVNHLLTETCKLVNDPNMSLLTNNTTNADVPEGLNLETYMFLNNRALFWVENVYGQVNLRQMVSDYGILPMPKWNAEADYYSHTHPGHTSVMAVPLSAPSVSLSGAILEEMARFSEEKVIPEFYEQTVRVRGSRDAESMEMLDMVYEHVIVDLAIVMGSTSNSTLKIDDAIRTMLKNGNTSFSSMFASTSKSFTQSIADQSATFAQNAADQG